VPKEERRRGRGRGGGGFAVFKLISFPQKKSRGKAIRSPYLLCLFVCLFVRAKDWRCVHFNFQTNSTVLKENLY
jgi:hypothetical protein